MSYADFYYRLTNLRGKYIPFFGPQVAGKILKICGCILHISEKKKKLARKGAHGSENLLRSCVGRRESAMFSPL